MNRAIFCRALVAVVALWLECQVAVGQKNRPAAVTTTFSTATSARFTIPIGGPTVVGETLGLQGSIFPDGINHLPGASYAPWRAELWRSDGLPFPRDQNLEIRFEHRDSIDSPMVIVPIELKQGQFSQSVRFLVPNYPNRAGHGGGYCHVQVLADGRALPGLQGNNWTNVLNLNSNKTTSRLPWLIVAEKQKILSELSDKFANDDRQALRRPNVQFVSDENIATTEWLPRDWRELTSLETVAVDAEAWKNLDALQVVAIKEYVYAGGDLFIYHCNKKAKSDSPAVEWFERIAGCRLNDAKNIGNGREKPSLFLKAEVGFGRIAFSELSLNEVYEGVQDTNYQIATNARTNRLFDVDKMKWLIEKIGRPPVLTFLFSIAVFSLVAGPGLLWWVNRKLQRPIWLLAAFPLVAGLLTLGIFFYAFIHDGVGLHGRLRSVTVANVAAGEACAYSRETYFSGFPPRQVNFNSKSEVWAIRSEHEEDDSNIYNSRSSTTMRLSDESLSFSGLITSRDQKQWIVTTPVGNFRPFNWTAKSDGEIELHYLLPEACLLGVWIDDAKQAWVVEDLAASFVGKLNKVSVEDAKKLITAKLPIDVYPLGYVDNSNQSLLDWFGSNRYRYRNNFTNLGTGTAGFESLANEWLQKKITEPRNFILFLERGSHIDRPCGDRVIESDGSHIVVGTW